jgi:hypothetical protein
VIIPRARLSPLRSPALRSGGRRLGGLLLGLAVLAGASAAPADAKEQLVPARFQTHNDGAGQDWSVDSRGNLQISRVGQVHQLQVNGVHFNSRSQLMTKDGREYVFEGQCGNVQVTRRVRVHAKLVGSRMVDIFDNPGPRPLTLNVRLTARMNMMPGRPVKSDQGQALSGSLGKKDRGLYVETSSNVTLVFGLTSKRSKVRPTYSQRHNYELTFTYQVKIPPKSKAALTYSVAKANGAISDKQRVETFRDFGKRAYTKDLPREIRRKLLNGSKGLGPAAGVSLASLEEELGLTGSTLDVLAFGTDTRVRGSAHCGDLSITSRFGKSKVSFEQVAALAGEAYQGGARIHFKDGQKLSGKIVAEGLRFEMTTGLSVNLRTERMDRLVIRRGSDGLRAAPPGRLLVETIGGDRLMVRSPPESQIGLATRWGVRKVPLARVKSLVRIGEGQPGFWVTLQDKSRFRAFFSEESLGFMSDLFGQVKFHSSEVRAVVSADALRTVGKQGEEEEIEVLQPHLMLVGGDIIVGLIDLEAITFAGTGEVLPIPPSQIRSLTNVLEGERPEFSEGIPFKAELWGGGEVNGVLRELLLPIQTGDGKIFVPAREVLLASVPTPQIPPALRARIASMIRQLGDSSWQKREVASRELKTLGELARFPLEEARDQTRDPEVERRVKALSTALEEK